MNWKYNLLSNYFNNLPGIFEFLLDFFQYLNFSSVLLEFSKVRHAIFGTSLNISYMILHKNFKIYIKVSKHILVNYFQYFIGSFQKKFLESISKECFFDSKKLFYQCMYCKNSYIYYFLLFLLLFIKHLFKISIFGAWTKNWKMSFI